MKLTNHINKIAFSDGNQYSATWDLTSVKQINFFIGPNNSGKSRLLREIYIKGKKELIFDTNLIPVKEFLAYAKTFDAEKQLSFQRHFRFRVSDFISNIEKIVKDDKAVGVYQLTDTILTMMKLSVRNYDALTKQYLIDPVLKPNQQKEKVLKEISELAPWDSIYIPTLRSLRHIDNEDLFHKRTSSDYFPKVNLGAQIFTGHTLYKDVKSHLLGTFAQRQQIRNYELYLSENFFFGQDISLVPRIDTDVLYFKKGEKGERPIYDLGDGIQSIIMLTYPVFMATKPTMFFIEEPELYLHAGLQRTLVETYANVKHSEHMFYITTHSNHFLDIAQERDDVSIQQVRQNEEGRTEVIPAAEFEELLTELGVRASSVLLANCSIWVEGITDKLYLRAYLNKYIEELREKGHASKANQLSSYHENLHFVFTEYQGSNITHWYFGDSSSNDKTSATPAKN